MRAGRVLFASALAHGALFMALAHWMTRRPRQTEPATPIAEPREPIEVDIVAPGSEGPRGSIEVAIIASPAASVTTATRAAPRSATHAGVGARAASATTATITTTSETATATGRSSSLFHMRAPDLEPLSVLSPIAGRGEPPPGPPRKSGKLDHAPNGKAVIHDRVTTVDVERDGTAHFHDKPDIDIHWTLPIPKIFRLDLDGLRRAVGEEITAWYADPEAGTRYGRTQDLPQRLQAVPGQCDSWGNPMCDDPLAPDAAEREAERDNGMLAGGNADVTAYLMRKLHVGDPYASRKRALLDSTRDERAARGGAYRADQLERSAEIMRKNLEQLWATVTDPAARREALFELWDECAEGEGPLGEAGERARAQVLGWIRAHATFTADEVTALNKRRASQQPFEP